MAGHSRAKDKGRIAGKIWKNAMKNQDGQRRCSRHIMLGSTKYEIGLKGMCVDLLS